MRSTSTHVFIVLMLLLLAADAVQAQAPGRIIGTLEEARGGQRLEGVNVVVVGTLYAAVSDAEGRFVLGPMPPGTYAVEVTALGFETERRAVTLAAGTEAGLVFRLHPPEIEVEEIEAAALRGVLQPVEALAARRLREINAHETGQLLRALPGTDAGRRGALDFEPTVRGLLGDQIGIYVDGIRYLAGTPYGFATPLSLFDPYMVDRVEVVKGPYALTWGAGNLSALRVTLQDAARAGTGLRSAFQAGYTSQPNAFDAAGTLAGAPGKASYQVQGAYRTGDDYKDGDGQTVPSDFRAASVRGQVAYRFKPSIRLVVQAGYQDRDDLDAVGYVLRGGASEATDVSARFQTAWAAGPLRALEATASWNRRAQTLTGANVISEGNNERLLAVDAEQADVGGRVAVRLVPMSGWTLEVGSDLYSVVHDATRQIDVDSPLDAAATVLRGARVTDAGFFAHGTRAFGSLEAAGTLRLDVVDARAELDETVLSSTSLAAGPVSETNVSGALALTTSLSSAWEVSMGLGSVVRTADAYERYAHQAPFRRAPFVVQVLGNPSLKPERSTQADLWLRGGYPKLELHLNAFVRRLNNYITTSPLVYPDDPPILPAATRYENHTATFYGAEVRAQYALMGDFATVNLGGTYLWGHDETLDEPALGIAPATVTAGGRLTAPADLFFLEGFLQGALAQTRVALERGERSTDGYLTLHLRFGLSLPRSSSVVLGVDNLAGASYANHLNARRLFSANSITEPGRVFYIRLRYGV